jgi:hypothetical protein
MLSATDHHHFSGLWNLDKLQQAEANLRAAVLQELSTVGFETGEPRLTTQENRIHHLREFRYQLPDADEPSPWHLTFTSMFLEDGRLVIYMRLWTQEDPTEEPQLRSSHELFHSRFNAAWRIHADPQKFIHDYLDASGLFDDNESWADVAIEAALKLDHLLTP